MGNLLNTQQQTNRTLASTVSQILRQPGLMEIAFALGNVQVSGGQFRQVAQAVDAGRIKCWSVDEFTPQGSDEVPDGRTVHARYGIDNNAMLFARPDFGKLPGEDQTIVHEAVHAGFDLSVSAGKKRSTLSIEDEAAAVLTTAFYIKLCKKELSGFRLGGGGEAEAWEIAEQAVRDPGLYTVRHGRYYFTLEETESLRYAVSVSRNYKKFIGSDGLPTDNSTALYIYDGVPVCTRHSCK
jgi:hypothetical protein